MIASLDFRAVREHYLHREALHRRLQEHLAIGAVHEYVMLALGITEPSGNYSASEHGLGPQILSRSTKQAVYDLAISLSTLPSAHHLPQAVYDAGLPFLRIAVGSEMAMMLNPSGRWVGNVRTIWSHLLLKHHGNKAKANLELSLYRDGERESEMDYKVWRDIYLAIEASLHELAANASAAALSQGVDPGTHEFLWADATANALYEGHASASR